MSGPIEIAPPEQLIDDIQCFWLVENDSSKGSAKPPALLSADAGSDVVLMASNPPCVLIIGPRSKPLDLPPAEDGIALYGIRFWPGAINRYISAEQGTLLLDNIVDAADIWPADVKNIIQSLTGKQLSTIDWQPFINALIAGKRNDKGVETVIKACKIMRYSAGDIRIDELANELAVSQRSLQRLFLKLTGLTPKQVSRISRFRQSCVPLAQTGDTSSLTQKYSDQAHLIKEYKALAGSTPKELVSRIESGEILQYEISPETTIKKDSY